MTETRAPLRLATTAIVVALAITSTPLPAQDAPPPDTSVDTPVAPTADPLGPEPATDTSVAPETTVAPESKPAASKATTATAKSSTVRRASAAARPTARPASTESAAAAPAAAGPVAAAPVAEAAPIDPPVPVRIEPASSRQEQMQAMLVLAGAALLGLIALIAGAVALRRRRRRREELDEQAVYEEAETTIEPELSVPAEPAPEPAYAAAPATAIASAPVPDPIPNETKSTGLPRGFDLSRFGPHVQAAYRGPTPNNPSASLKHRIRQAGMMDRREGTYRCEPARTAPADPSLAARPETVPADGDFMLRRGGEAKATVRRAYSE